MGDSSHNRGRADSASARSRGSTITVLKQSIENLNSFAIKTNQVIYNVDDEWGCHGSPRARIKSQRSQGLQEAFETLPGPPG